MKVIPGNPYPLGATWDGHGVNFAIYSEHATKVELCLFDAQRKETRVALTAATAFVWHGYIPELQPGQLYGYRVHGAYEPENGLRFNANNLLLDPYAKALSDRENWDDGVFAYELGAAEEDLKPSERDQHGVPLAMVIDPVFDWEGDVSPNTPFHRMVIYEASVKGLTARHPDVPPALQGTYSAVTHPSVIAHLQELGVTALELLPVHAFVDDKTLLDKGLHNYWGYNTIGFFAPDVRYRSREKIGSGVAEFKQMVKALHKAGIEVILDVVYNHTAEGNHLGPTFSFKGIDNPTYYRLTPENKRFYFDYTGTGNSLNVRHPQTLQLIMDSLRYWIVDMHVDGFRFDLAATLARGLFEVDQLSSFFTIIHQDPIISQVKLIAEPWDVGEGGYQVGNFPVRWAEWNGKYRDTMRSFWKGDGSTAADLGYRISGSSDLYENDGRRPFSSINFISAHDGFTIADLVSYNDKHNEKNGEDNKDGTTDNRSWNCGAEGPTNDNEIKSLRARQQRNLLATLLLSQGTPMICGGDEFGRTQQGNNNAYCQDNEISWHDWQLDDTRRALLEFSRKVVALRHAHPALRRSKFFKGRPIRGMKMPDVMWLRNDGEQMNDENWGDPQTHTLGMFLNGGAIDDVDANGDHVIDDSILVLSNASHVPVDFRLPTISQNTGDWTLVLDTGNDAAAETRKHGEVTPMIARSLKVFTLPKSKRA